MMKLHLLPLLLVTWTAVCLPSFATAADKLPVFVSIAPQAFLAERLGGAALEVDVLVGPGQDLHTFEPTPKQMAKLARARLYFTIGVPFEDQMVRRIASTHPRLVLVDSIAGIERRAIEDQHQHAGHDHADAAPDPHVWLNPRLTAAIARNMAQALILHDPEAAASYRANLARLEADLAALDARIGELLAPLRGQDIFVYHPAFGYLTEAYGLHQVPVEMGGREPSARELTRLIERARHKDIRVLFVQPQFSRRSAEAIARAIDGAVVAIDPLARDYLANLEQLARTIHDALLPSGRPSS